MRNHLCWIVSNTLGLLVSGYFLMRVDVSNSFINIYQF